MFKPIFQENDAVVPPPGYEVPQPSQFGNVLFVKQNLGLDWVELTTDPIHHSDTVGSFDGVKLKLAPLNPYPNLTSVKQRQVSVLEQGRTTSSDPATYYNGFSTLDEMAEKFGKKEARDWCFLTAYKYLARMGKKENNSVEQETKKAMDYLVQGMRLTKELDAASYATSRLLEPGSANPTLPTP